MKALLVGYSDPAVHASTRTRIFQYLPHLERAGMSCEALSIFHPRAIGARWYRPGLLPLLPYTAARVARAAAMARRADVTMIHQTLLPRPFHRALWRAPVIYSFTDIPTARPSDRDRTYGDLERRFHRSIREARWVIVENPANTAWVEQWNPNVVTIVGPIDTDRYVPSERSAGASVTIGWIGSPSTSPYLADVEAALARLRRDFPSVRIELVGATPGSLERAGATIHPWSLETECEHLARFDVGIMPLPDTRWTRAKGGYKLLQYMALGIPSVTSPVGINTELIVDGSTGFLARDPGEWYARLAALVGDAAARARIGAEARRVAEERYSVRAASRTIVSLMREAAGRGEQA